MRVAIPKTKGRSLRGRQVAEYLRGRSDDNAGTGGDEDSGDGSQTHMHRSSGGDDSGNGGGRPDSGDELSETGAEG